MSSQRRQRVKRLFLDATDLEETARDAFLDRQCGGDDDLRREVESLLAYHDTHTLIVPSAGGETQDLAAASTVKLGERSRRRLIWRLARPYFAVGPGGQLALGGVLATLLLAGLGYWVYDGVRDAIHEMWVARLEFLVDAEVTAVEHWLQNEQDTVRSWVRDDDVVDHVVRLLAVDASIVEGQAALARSPHQSMLREVIISYVGTHVEYVIHDVAGVVIASSVLLEHQLGMRVAPENAITLARVLEGETIVRLPFVPHRLDGEGPRQSPPATVMAVVTPVRNDAGEVIATVSIGGTAMREEFDALLSNVRTGKTGETYAFDQTGTMISESRFREDLKRLGLLEDSPEVYSVLNVTLRDPGKELAGEHVTAEALAARPFTTAVANALAGRDGVDLDGYRDYRGVPVVGAWRWLEDYEFGIVTEVDFDEAAAVGRYFDVAFSLLFGVLLLSVATVLVSSYRIARLRWRIGEAMELGPYTLEGKIGEGGMGEVYLARHSFLKRPTAIKLLKPTTVTHDAVKRFEREVQAASQLAHPNTIEIYDYGHTASSVFYCAMEFIDGLTLTQLVEQEGPVSPARVVFLLRQICGSLAEAHGQGLVHRDVSPRNIMVSRRGGVADMVKVLDFGLAKPIDLPETQQITATGMLTGTPLYIAPERFRDPTSTDPRGDIYATGAVAYHLLTARHPYEGENQLDLVYQIVNSEPKKPSDVVGSSISPELESLVMQCIEKKPEKRPASMAEVLGRLREMRLETIWDERQAAIWWDRFEQQESKAAAAKE